MSLIPSESLSFPDDFSRAISRARVLHEQERYARKNKRGKSAKRSEQPRAEIAPAPSMQPRPTLEANPTPEPVVAEPAVTIAPPPQQPAPSERPLIARKPLLGKTSASAVALKGKVRPAGVQTPAPARLTKADRPAKVDVDLGQKAENRPVSATPRSGERERILPLPPVQRRRRRKMQRFWKIEIPAGVVLAAAAAAGLTHQIHDSSALMALNIITIAAAFICVVTPIVLFAKTPTLPANER
jgi:hypothetical protein